MYTVEDQEELMMKKKTHVVMDLLKSIKMSIIGTGKPAVLNY
jgi:hypothetical protein